MKKKSSPIDSDMNFVSDLDFTDHSETFSASYRGLIPQNLSVTYVVVFKRRRPRGAPPPYEMTSIMLKLTRRSYSNGHKIRWFIPPISYKIDFTKYNKAALIPCGSRQPTSNAWPLVRLLPSSCCAVLVQGHDSYVQVFEFRTD